jgi:hypothetical protein
VGWICGQPVYRHQYPLQRGGIDHEAQLISQLREGTSIGLWHSTGIAYGQHWLNVQFQKSLVRVPFRILTKDEETFLSKNYKSIDTQVKEAFTPKK